MVACAGQGFPELEAIQEDLRERVASGLTGQRSAGEATCVEDDTQADRRTYDCQVQVFAVRPRDDQLVRFRVVARSDGSYDARRTGVVGFR